MFDRHEPVEQGWAVGWPRPAAVSSEPIARLLSLPGGEAQCVRSPRVRGARRSARRFLNNAGVLEQYVEHGEQAQRSNGGRIVCFDRQAVRNAG